MKTDLDPATMGMDLQRVERAITKNTIAVYASAPTFTHGVVDPIAELSELLTVSLVTHTAVKGDLFVCVCLLACLLACFRCPAFSLLVFAFEQ